MEASHVDLDLQPPGTQTWQLVERAGQTFALSLLEGTELLERVRATPIPLPPRGAVGLISWQGNPIVLTDIHVLQGRPRNFAATRALVVGRGLKAVALAIDALPTLVQAIGKNGLAAMPPQGLADCIAGHFALPEGKTAWILNVDELTDRLMQPI
jgi:chemotaxis signal transduction protein